MSNYFKRLRSSRITERERCETFSTKNQNVTLDRLFHLFFHKRQSLPLSTHLPANFALFLIGSTRRRVKNVVLRQKGSVWVLVFFHRRGSYSRNRWLRSHRHCHRYILLNNHLIGSEPILLRNRTSVIYERYLF